MGFGETEQPEWVGADLCVGVGVKVAVAALLVATEDDCGVVFGFWAGGDIVKEVLGLGEMAGAGVEVAAE